MVLCLCHHGHQNAAGLHAGVCVAVGQKTKKKVRVGTARTAASMGVVAALEGQLPWRLVDSWRGYHWTCIEKNLEAARGCSAE